MIERLLDKLTYANVVAMIALFGGVLPGTRRRLCRLPRSLPTASAPRQLKAKAVTGGKIANGDDLRRQDRSGNDHRRKHQILRSWHSPDGRQRRQRRQRQHGRRALGRPPLRNLADRFSASTDTKPEVPSLNAAADACAAKGGWLPTPMELMVRQRAQPRLRLGHRKTVHRQPLRKVSKGNLEATAVIFGNGQIEKHEVNQPAQYYCVYPLVR